MLFGWYVSECMIVIAIFLYSVAIVAFCIFAAKKLQKYDFIRKYCFGK